MGRRLGQHFLKRDSILKRIAGEACPCEEPLVIEIGPGRGALTKHLLERSGRLIAIETDPFLAGWLEQKYAGESRLQVVRGDVLKTDLGQWGPAVVAGNLPYYITSPILRRTLELGEKLRRAVFLVQKEVAERLTAKPGSRQYGLLTALTQLRAEAEILFSVPPSAFAPPPKVDSAAVRLTPRAPSTEGPHATPEFEEFLALSFRQKRKTLRNNLAGVYSRSMLAAIPETSRRAEQLSLEELSAVYERLKQRS